MALDQLSRDWAQAKRQEKEDLHETMRLHRIRTARHPGETRRQRAEQEREREERIGMIVALGVVLLFLCAVAGGLWLVRCSVTIVGC